MSPQIMTSHQIEEVCMFDHVSIGVRDLARAKQFYDAALRPLGYACLSEGADALGYGREKIALWIGKAARPVPPDTGSNLHFCFAAPTREAVDAFHAAALSAGGTDYFAPLGQRTCAVFCSREPPILAQISKVGYWRKSIR
jgi:catechol 2,3-dioxygenase-like lactoylglutathione lyase family enzyme